MAFTIPSTGPTISPSAAPAPLAASSPQVQLQPGNGPSSTLHTAPPPPGIGQTPPYPCPTQVQAPHQTQPVSIGQIIPRPNQGASAQVMSQPPAEQSLPYPTQGAAIPTLSQTQATPIGQTSPYPTSLPQSLPPASGGQSLSVSVHMTPPAPVEQTLPYPTHGAPVQAPPVPPASVGQTLPYPTNLSVSAQAPVEQTFTTYPTQHALSLHGPPVSTGQTLPYPPLASLTLSPQPTPLPPLQQEQLPYPLQPAPAPSPPSAPVSGAPINVRVSTKRTQTLIKLRWQPSFIRPEAAVYYEVEMRPKKTFQILSSWKVVATCSKFSGKATNLQPNTAYEFRVRAMNAEGTPSPYSEIVMGTTKGGGAVSRSAYSGLSKVADSGGSLFGSSKLKGKNPSGARATVFGKLSQGMSSAGNYLGNKAKEHTSPQSSDDE